MTRKPEQSVVKKSVPSVVQGWYIRHRPQTIEEIDQERVRSTILSFVQRGRFPHALLFAGPKGTGKTSTARIVAKILNCETSPDAHREPCNVCSHCREITQGNSMAVIELDGASNRGIEDVRAIRESVKLAAPSAQTKVYIIDEAHMLTSEAANALLKTLEEPPPKVVFILATTEVHKISETIRSRCTMIQFSRATRDELLRSFGRVVEREGIKSDAEALDMIVDASEGSFRDGIKLIEQLAQQGTLSKEHIVSFLHDKSYNPIVLIGQLARRNIQGALGEIDHLAASGVNMQYITISFVDYLHHLLLAKLGVETDGVETDLGTLDIQELIKRIVAALEEMRTCPIPELPLELAIIEWVDSKEVVAQSLRSSDSSPLGAASNKRDILSSSVSASVKNKGIRKEIKDQDWKEILAKIKLRNHSVSALLRSTRPIEFDGTNLTIGVFYQFHKEKLEQEVHRHVIEEVVTDVLGEESIRVTFILEERPGKLQKKPESFSQQEPEDLVKAAEEIFGAN